MEWNWRHNDDINRCETKGEVSYMFGPANPGEFICKLLLFVVFFHSYGKLFTYFLSTEVIPVYLSLVVNCFVFQSMDIG